MSKGPVASDESQNQETQIYQSFEKLFEHNCKENWHDLIPYLLQRDGGYKLAEALRDKFKPDDIITHGKDSKQYVWEQLGWFFFINNRFHESIYIYIFTIILSYDKIPNHQQPACT